MQEVISVVVTVYNVGNYLRQCIDSVINQTYRNLEIILIDDGSTDISSKICDEYAAKDERVLVIHKEKEGAPKARKTGLENAHGEYISIIDGDDWMDCDMLEKMYSALIEQDVDVAMCGRYEVMGEQYRPVKQGIPAGRYDGESMMYDVYPNMVVNKQFFEWGIFPSLWDKLFKTEVLEKYLMDVENTLPMANDAACVYPCMLNVNSIYILDECLYYYRQTNHSMVKNAANSKKTREGFRLLYQSVNESFEKYSHIYDLRDQWLDYLLFLMIPRADVLYEGMENLNYLFPFPDVRKGSNIILYGMGMYGQRLYGFLRETGFCNVVAAVDRNYENLRRQGMHVEAPENIQKYEYDAIVVTMSFAGAQQHVYDYLAERYPVSKIHVMNKDVAKSEESRKAFGLL